jgi:uncharacterized membrane protein YqgA involved in biofilm formation
MKKYIVIRLFFLASSVAIAQVMLPAFQRDSQTINLKRVLQGLLQGTYKNNK